MSGEKAQGSASKQTGALELEQNEADAEDSSEHGESTEEPEALPDSWETMAEDAAGHESARESAGVTLD